MNFKKLALAAAVAVAPMSALALEPMQDDALSAVTGQDGISIALDPGASGLSLDVYVHDTDGAGTGLASAGAIVIDNMNITGKLNIDIDAGDSAAAATSPVLNVEVSMPDGLTLKTGDISVANSNRDDAPPAWGIDSANQTDTILESTSITLGAGTSLNIQLGNETQGNMIKLASTITNGLTIGVANDFTDNLSVTDAGGTVNGGVIGASAMTIVDNGSGNLTLGVGVDINADGLVIDMSNQGAMDIRMQDVFLGTADAAHTLGDVELVGLGLSTTSLTITGK